jgi:hypothetical protein
VTIFGDRAFKEIIYVINVSPSSHRTDALIRKERDEERPMRTQGGDGCPQAKERDPIRKQPCQHLDLEFPVSVTVRR